MDEKRDMTVNGALLVDPTGRWLLKHATGERPFGRSTVGVSTSPFAHGARLTRSRFPIQQSEMMLDFLVTAQGVGGGGERARRDRNLAELVRSLRLGRESTVSLNIAGEPCSQRCIITAGSEPVEHSPDYVEVFFHMLLLDGVWVAERSAERVAGAVEQCYGGSGHAQVVWAVEGPATGFSATQGETIVCEWAGNVPSGRLLVIDGWDSWTVPADTVDWWQRPNLGVSHVEVAANDPVEPDEDGEYAVTVRVNGVEQRVPSSSRVWAYAGAPYL